MSPTRATVRQAEASLADRDPVLAGLVARYGPCTLSTRRTRPDDHFAALAEAILYQQLAGAAAATIHARFVAVFDGPPTPAAVLAVPVDRLRQAGLSGAKASAIVALAEAVTSGRLELDRLSRRSDDEVVSQLVSVRGIGPWTAHMFCIFTLGRLDVWPTTDFGVRTGYARAFGLAEPPAPKVLEPLGEPFRPWRSVVAWYLWRVVEDRGLAAAP